MKSTVNAFVNKDQFPWIGMHRKTQEVVLFTAENIGTIIANPPQLAHIGQHFDCLHIGDYAKFMGEVVLSND